MQRDDDAGGGSPAEADADASHPELQGGDLPPESSDAFPPQELADSFPEATHEPEVEVVPPDDENADDGRRPPRAAFDPFANIAWRHPKSRTSPVRPSYCQAPPQADALCRARSTTSRTFEQSQTPSDVFNPREIYWRDRCVLERDRKRRFDHAVLVRSQRRFGFRSPYLYDLGRHRDAVHAAFERELEERETRDMRSRHASMMRHMSAVQRAWDHDERLVKKDRFHRIQPSLRILVLNTG
jgi:hypothetical protein